MKNKGICPKCDSQEIGYLENVIHRTEAEIVSQSVRGHCSAPLGVERTESEGVIKIIKEGPVGELEAYFCCSCGFYETYIKEPSSIQFENIIGFKMIDHSS